MSLSTAATVVEDNDALPLYHWFECDADGTLIGSEISSSPTMTLAGQTVGTHRYRCEVTYWGAAPTLSDVATVTVAVPTVFQITEGAGGTWTKGGDAGLGFTADADYSRFTEGGSVRVDGALVASEHYTSAPGSTVITLSPSYLETLSVGQHDLRIDFSNGHAETTFTISNPVGSSDPVENAIPSTGDSLAPILWIGGLIMVAGALLTGGAIWRKRQDG